MIFSIEKILIKDQQKKLNKFYVVYLFFASIVTNFMFVLILMRWKREKTVKEILSAHKFCDYLIVSNFMDLHVSWYLTYARKEDWIRMTHTQKTHSKIRYKSEIIFLLLLSFVGVKKRIHTKGLHWDLSLLFDDTRLVCFFTWFHLRFLQIPLHFTLRRRTIRSGIEKFDVGREA